MLILSDCFLQTDNEGCIKTAQSIAKRCRQTDGNTCLVSFSEQADYIDVTIRTNKLLWSRRLYQLIKKTKEDILYIPFSSGTKAGILRIWTLTGMAGRPIKVLFTGRHPTSPFFSFLLRHSRAELYVLSEESAAYYRGFTERVTYLRTGVDTKQFRPVGGEEKRALRKKYGFGADEKILLHAGHLKEGRGLRAFLPLSERYTSVLVISDRTKDTQDAALRQALSAKPGLRLIETYQPHMEELYQLADVYLFPVVEQGNCIDTPLSVLEALACGIPVVTSDYGALKELRGQEGVYMTERFDKETLEMLIEQALAAPKHGIASSVQAYDWQHAVRILLGQGSTGKDLPRKAGQE